MKKRILLLSFVLCCICIALISCSGSSDDTANNSQVVETVFGFESYMSSATEVAGKLSSVRVGTDTHVVVPSVTNNGNPVEKIGSNAFQSNEKVTGVTIPKSVKIIDENAFAGCINLKTIIFEDGAQLKEIGAGAFEGCVSLETIAIPQSVSKINESAFSGCKSLKKVTITNEGVDCELCTGVFSGCEALKMIYVPKRVYLRTNVFDETLEWLVYGGTLSQFDEVGVDSSHILQEISNCTEDGIVWNPYGEDKAYVYAYVGDEAEVDLTKGIDGRDVCSIEKGAFKNCETITKIVIPETVSNIGKQAFYGCKNLNEINIPSSIEKISEQAFYECLSLEKIELPASIVAIENSAFENCTSLKAVTGVDGASLEVGAIRSAAFKNCSSLEQISISLTNDSLTRIEQKLYGNLSEYVGGLLGSSIAIDICEGAFEGCSSLKSFSLKLPILLSSAVTRIESRAFASCANLETISIDGLAKVGNSSFLDCQSIKSVGGSNHQYTEIASSTFFGCKSLEDLSTLNSVTAVGNYAFSGCSSLKAANFGSNLTTIGTNAFEGCTSLSELSIPSSVTSLGDSVFLGCTGIKKLSINTDFVSLAALDGCSVEELTIPAVWFDGDIELQVSNKLTVTGTGCFNNLGHNSINVESVVISDGFTSIGENALRGTITNITIPSTVTAIGENAFDTNHANVYYTGSVEQWCNIEFYNQESNPLQNGGRLYISDQEVKLLTIPDTVSRVNDYAFAGCVSIENIEFVGEGLSIELGVKAFAECDALGEIFLPKGVYRVCEKCFYDSSVTGLEAESLPCIEDGAFQFCDNLKYAKINKTTEIGSSAFESCDALETVEFESIQTIKGAAFFGCKSLKEVALPISIAYLESGVFSDGVEGVYFVGNLKWKYTTINGSVEYVYAGEITLFMLNDVEIRKWERVYE